MVNYSISTDASGRAYIWKQDDSGERIVTTFNDLSFLIQFVDELAKTLYYDYDFEVIYDIPF